MTQSITFTPVPTEVGERLDKLITDRLNPDLGLSRARVQNLIKEGFVEVDGKPGKPAYRVEGDESITVNLHENVIAPPEANAHITPESIPLRILYEDQLMVAVDKPAGMVVHPAPGHAAGTLVNAILSRYPEAAQAGGEGRAGIVHRLDKDTSGVILVARTEAARLTLMRQFAARTVQKRYLALVEGVPATLTGEINAPLGRDPHQRKQIAVMPANRGGRESVSHFKVIERLGDFSLLEVLPKTGRTHQIRVHLAFIGHPIVGDSVYGRRKQQIKLSRHFLHAESLTLIAPASGQAITISAPLPPELEAVLKSLRETS